MLAAGYLSLGFAYLSLFSEVAALHLLGIGSVGGMTLAVMSRATLGHTGRALTASPGLNTAYLLITLAAFSRIIAPLYAEGYLPLVTLSAAAWVGAFVCFLLACGPMLLGPRVDAVGAEN